MQRVCFKLALAAAFGLPAACGYLGGCIRPDAKVRPILLNTEGVKAEIDYADLAVVLKEAVRKDGLVYPKYLRRQAKRLEAQLARLAVTGPTATPRLLARPEDRLAYWYNARAAWALSLALRSGCPKKLPAGRLEARQFPLDGRTMSLGEIDAAVDREGGWRALVAAPGIRPQRGRMPRLPFAAKDIRERIDERLNGFIDDKERLVIDIKGKRVLVPAVLWRLRSRLIALHHKRYATTGANLKTALLAHVKGSAHRRLQDALGYRCTEADPSDNLAIVP